MSETQSDKDSERGHDEYPKGRLDAFTDGVLAIVITILVLELKVPPVSESADLWHALTGEWRDYAGYLISFVFVGGIWITHSSATSYIKRADGVVFRLNLVILFFVSLLPFLTSLMTTHLGESGENLAVALYGADLFIASGLLSVFIGYAAHHPDLAADDLADESLRSIEVRRRALLVGQCLAVLLALFWPNGAVALYLVLSFAFLILPLVLARRNRRSRRGATAR